MKTYSYILLIFCFQHMAFSQKSADNLSSFSSIKNQDHYVIDGQVKDKSTQMLLPGSQVSLYDDNNILIAQKVVSNDAKYVFNIEFSKKYRLEAVRDFYIPCSLAFTTNEEGKLRYTIDLSMDRYDGAEELITKRQDGKVQIVLENIYFDLDQWNIKPDATKVLEVLIELLNKYPEMYIKIDAHTDSRASATYNVILSDKRASATLDYLVKNGIDIKRLQSKGYGESEPLIDCANRNCTEQEHSINRRCEFIILK